MWPCSKRIMQRQSVVEAMRNEDIWELEDEGVLGGGVGGIRRSSKGMRGFQRVVETISKVWGMCTRVRGSIKRGVG